MLGALRRPHSHRPAVGTAFLGLSGHSSHQRAYLGWIGSARVGVALPHTHLALGSATAGACGPSAPRAASTMFTAPGTRPGQSAHQRASEGSSPGSPKRAFLRRHSHFLMALEGLLGHLGHQRAAPLPMGIASVASPAPQSHGPTSVVVAISIRPNLRGSEGWRYVSCCRRDHTHQLVDPRLLRGESSHHLWSVRVIDARSKRLPRGFGCGR
mmetsp:Transcript_20896/g.54582  ORF Transcript_20896/g.54582 Transcript_20896/m.54582 type:complete len:212 (+) Transcript_20896:765-1400(+)